MEFKTRVKKERFSSNSIKVRNLKVWTPEEKSWWRQKVTKAQTVILNNVSGDINEGDFVAIIGPSGAGKTTFLVTLAGKCTLPSEGAVVIQGRNVRDIPQGVVDMVPQLEVFMDNLSVLEHLVFMTEMKLGSSNKPSNRLTMDKLINELKLKEHEQTSIGDLSGGERRLLSLATSLLSSPQILICDEPTTGLDSYNAALVIGVLKNIALTSKIVVCSVHQPSSDLFKEFSSIMLMAEGRLLYHGSQEEFKELFESINLRCPKNYNPAEFYIRAVSTNPNSNENYAHRLMEININRSDNEGTGSEEYRPETQLRNVSQRNWFKQIQLLTWRSSLSLMRDAQTNLFKLFVCMTMSSIVIGTCYIGINGRTQQGIQDFRGFLWLICSEISFSLSYNALYVFESDLTLFRREVGLYKGSAYFVSRFLSLVPNCIIWPTSFVIIATFAVEIPNYIITSMEFIAALIAGAVAATAYGLGMGALFTSTGLMSEVMPCVDLPLLLMSGAVIRISSVPVWLYPVKYVSHFFYSMDAISNIYWRQIDHIDCPANYTLKCANDGVTVLTENGYSKDYILEDGVGLLMITLAWSLLGYYGLRREEKKGYAY